ncbi:MAG: malto-oligosyltrehalose trehalohydrolase, partial [Clostridia bacterium]|nr:malto-oligosyltrehalose trehalohydrolase [Deltaproteobacteria bacterium]
MPIGAEPTVDGVHFRVWAPGHSRVDLVVAETVVALTSDGKGYFAVTAPELAAGARYGFRVDGEEKVYPDPASRYQPDGPHGLSAVVDPESFIWTDAAWAGATTRNQVIYEMHVGTFTHEGTYAAAVTKLAHLAKVGVTVIELMPLAEFEGTFGWGYDGVDWFAPTRLYGDPDALRAFVDRAHAEGISVILDVVYNHLGPDGNYLKCFSEAYFDSKHTTDWGEALNYDGALSAGVREYVLANVRHWISEYHFDGLRIDATQDIHDTSAVNILRAITEEARAAAGAKSVIIIAENEPQDAELVRNLGYDLLWNDDFH